MKTYQQFINEKFLKGVEGSHDYTEIFMNPNSDDIQHIGHESIGAIMTDKDLYVWERRNCTHNAAAAAIGLRLGSRWLPLIIYQGVGAVYVSLSAFSVGHLGKQDIPKIQDVVAQAKSHRGFKVFQNIKPY
jgi:hypothetical protein